MATEPHAPVRVSLVARCAGTVACAVARIAARSVRFDRLVTVVRATAARLPAADRDRAAAVLAAVDTGSELLPLRIACLERSLAAVLLAAVRGRALSWCYGARPRPPLLLHAWIEVDGHPVGEPAEVADYLPIRRIRPGGNR